MVDGRARGIERHGLRGAAVVRERHEQRIREQDALRARHVVEAYPDIREVLDILVSGELTRGEPSAFWPIVESLVEHGDPYLVLADFAAYRFCQARVDADFGRQDKWTRMSILNSARTYRFSSDETISAYAREIWKSKAPA